MPQRYVIREEPDKSWSVVQEGTSRPVSLAGIPQTGLHPDDAKQLAETLSRMGARTAREPAVQH